MISVPMRFCVQPFQSGRCCYSSPEYGVSGGSGGALKARRRNDQGRVSSLRFSPDSFVRGERSNTDEERLA